MLKILKKCTSVLVNVRVAVFFQFVAAGEGTLGAKSSCTPLSRGTSLTSMTKLQKRVIRPRYWSRSSSGMT